MTNYVQLLCREINSTKDENKTDQPLEKVFFCSGTPSLVPPKLVNSVLETLRLKFGLSSLQVEQGTKSTVLVLE
ncbi:hypothetical protein ACFX1W_038900 [Malus domestica]